MHQALREWVRRILRLPIGNPELPAAIPAEVRRVEPAPRYLSYALFWYWIGLGVLGAPILGALGIGGAVAAVAASQKNPLLGILVGTGMVLFLLLSAAWVWFQYFVTTLEVEMLRYTFTDRAMRLRRGVLELVEVTISYANIQNVRLEQGPLQRAYGLADLIVETAGGGGGAQEPGMEPTGHRGLIKGVGDAAQLRDWLLERMRACRGAGLGDAHDLEDPAGFPAPIAALPAEAIAGLEAIRDELRRANQAAAARFR